MKHPWWFFPSPNPESLQKGPPGCLASGWEAQWLIQLFGGYVPPAPLTGGPAGLWVTVQCPRKEGLFQGSELWYMQPPLCNTLLSQWIPHSVPTHFLPTLSQHLFHCAVTYMSVFTIRHWTYRGRGLNLIFFVCPELSRYLKRWVDGSAHLLGESRDGAGIDLSSWLLLFTLTSWPLAGTLLCLSFFIYKIGRIMVLTS